MKKSISEKGKLPIKKILAVFDEGDKVMLKANSTFQNGLFNLRFHGKTGEISGKQGSCYKVQIKDGNKAKTCVVHPVHLNRV